MKSRRIAAAARCVWRGRKNAVLPQMAAALLTEEPVRILDAPELTDVGRMAQMLIDLGGTVRSEGGALDIVCASPRAKASGTIEGLTRASVLALGPLLARCGEATLALPGGCRIGARPIDIHLSGFEAMRAQVSVQDGVVSARGRLHPARYRMKFPSVGATENIMLAAALTPGESVIETPRANRKYSTWPQCCAAWARAWKGPEQLRFACAQDQPAARQSIPQLETG